MFDIVAVKAGTLEPIGKASDLKLDQVLKNFAFVAAMVIREDIEVEVSIRKHKDA